MHLQEPVILEKRASTVHHTELLDRPSSFIGCDKHKTIRHCMIPLGVHTNMSEVIQRWEEDGEFNIGVEFPEEEHQEVIDSCKRFINWPYKTITPDWGLLEDSCILTRLWISLSALRRIKRASPGYLYGEEFAQQTLGLDAEEIMHNFHEDVKTLWELVGEWNLIKPRWRVSILETYVDWGDFIGANYSGNALSVVSLIQWDRFAQTVYPPSDVATAKHNQDYNENCCKFVKGKEPKEYSPHRLLLLRGHTYTNTFLFSRLKEQLMKTPVLYNWSRDMVYDLIMKPNSVPRQLDKQKPGESPATVHEACAKNWMEGSHL